mmetsp:Transcript_95869/g.140055  ORF Transcript_95869/g.140055 Transcript_95869/m.140055 type:complete len:93 (+) Transcript_95869:144-422(+)
MFHVYHTFVTHCQTIHLHLRRLWYNKTQCLPLSPSRSLSLSRTQPGNPTRGMLALNGIIKGSKHFKTPPPSQDVYKVVTRNVVHRDPLVAAS